MRRNKQKVIEFKGSTFVGVLKNGKLAVRTQRSAQGQSQLVAIWDPTDKTWGNESSKFPLPTPVKREFELAFAK